MRVTKGDIVIECADQAELGMALLALSAPVTAVRPSVGFGPLKAELFSPQVPQLDCAMGVAELGEYIPEDDEQRLRLVADENTCGPAGDPRTDTFLPGEIGRPKPVAPQHVPVSRKLLDVLEAVMLFPEGVYAKGIGELLGLTRQVVSSRLQALAAAGLTEHLADNQSKWRATPKARRSKLVAC